MEKAGWQIAAFIAGMAAVAGAFGTVANKRAAEQALEDLKEARAAKKETVTVHQIHRGACIPTVSENIGMRPWPEGAECHGGVLLLRKPNGWESVLSDGKPVPCR